MIAPNVSPHMKKLLNKKSQIVPTAGMAMVLWLVVGCGKTPTQDGSVGLTTEKVSASSHAPDTNQAASAIVADAAAPTVDELPGSAAAAGSRKEKRTLEEQ